MNTTRIAFALLAAACALPAGARQEAVPAEVQAADAQAADAQTVILRGVRDPDIAPYKMFYEMMSKVRKAGGGKVDLLVRVVSKQSGQPVSDLEITLQGDKAGEKLAVAPDGFLAIPVNGAYVDDNAVFLTNKKQGTLGVEIYVVPNLSGTAFTYGDIAASIAAGKRGLAELLPWYVRLFAGKVDRVKLCYPDNGREIAIAHGAAIRKAADEQKSPLTRERVYCAAFTDQETRAAQDTVIAPPAGWVAVFD